MLFLAAIASSLIVLDTCRVGAFSFPFIFAARAQLHRAGMPSSQIHKILAFSAAITPLAPNYEIIVGVAVRWLPSMRLCTLSSLIDLSAGPGAEAFVAVAPRWSRNVC